MSGEVLALVNYYARSGFYRHVQTVCNEVLKKRGGSDPTLTFWRALGTLKEGGVNDAIRELEGVAARGDMQLALPVKLALLHANLASRVVDHEEVSHLESEVAAEASSAPDRARLHAALLLWHLGERSEARVHVNALLDLQPHSVPSLTLLGWLELQDAEAAAAAGDAEEAGSMARRAATAFDEALANCSAKKDLEALMGRARLLRFREQHKEALDELNQVIVLYAWFLPALVEKCHVLVAMGDWEQALEISQRVLAQDAHSIEALRLNALHTLSHEGNYASAMTRLGDLADAMRKQEPANAALYYRTSRPIARLAGNHAGVLNQSVGLAERACQLDPQNAAYAAELAYQELLLGNVSSASATLKRAATLEQGSNELLQYNVRCLLAQGELDEAEGQLEFITAIAGELNETTEIHYCRAILAEKRAAAAAALGGGEPDGGGADVIGYADSALEVHMRSIRRVPLDADYFAELSPALMLELAAVYLRHTSHEPEVLDAHSKRALNLTKATKLLEVVARKVPGLLEAHLQLARARYLASDFEGALRACSACTTADAAYASASLLHAEILLRTGAPAQAHAVLEQALAQNFAVRESAPFHLVKARVLREQDDAAGAARLLEAAMGLPGVAKPVPSGKGSEVTAHERCSIFLELAELHVALSNGKDAKALLKQAVVEFSGTCHEGRVTISTAKMHVAGGNVERAIKMLQDVPAENPNYHAARVTMADLYLVHRNDRRVFAACHEELVRATPTAQAHILLGEAYMRIVEPAKAIKAFEVALTKNPNDANLASRIGKVLVTTHEYAKAIQYYEAAVKRDPSKRALRLELAELFIELKRYDKAAAELDGLEAGADDGAHMPLDEATLFVSALRLRARLGKAQGRMADAVSALERAKAAQTNILARVRIEAVELVGEQKRSAAELCHQLGEYHELCHDADAALAAYSEAVGHADTHGPSMLALARVHLSRAELEPAEKLCTTLMSLEPNNNDAALLLADVMAQRAATSGKGEWDAATYHIEQMLEKAPTNYRATAQLIQLLRRAGRIGDAAKYLTLAERYSSKAPLEPGWRYCRGVLCRYQNDPRAALAALNTARRDAEWGDAALHHMVEIFLHPEDEDVNWEELNLDAGPGEPTDAARAAEHLLREMRPSPRATVLECYTMLSYKSKARVERAVSTLLELLNTERDFLPALVCLSQAYLMIKQAPKARNYLKRVAKMPFVFEMADDFEKGWLMLAEVYITSGKYDLAEELCRKCLGANKSCAKAWEYLGVVKEKEMSYVNAASHYESAWTYAHEASATVGYRLSFNYLKAKKYVEAIDVCHKVLKHFPDYPKIRTDVMEKAREALRP